MTGAIYLEMRDGEACLRCDDASVPVNPEEFRVWAISSGFLLHQHSAGREELLLETEDDRLYVTTTWLA